MIWRAVLGDSRYHIIRKENKIGHLRCKRTRYYGCLGAWDWETPSRLSCWGNLDSAEIWHPLSGRNEPTDGDIIPFLQACRQVYSESIDLLYSTNYFSFKDIDCLRFLAYTTLPHRFNLIRKIEITWPLQWPIYDPLIQNLMLSEPALYPPHDEATWESTWGIIAQMPKLKYIRVNLCHCHGFREPESETKMFKSMLQVKHVKDFEVTVSWPAQDLPEAPFKLLRTHDPRLSPLASPDDQDW